MKGYRVIIEVESKISAKLIEKFMEKQFGQPDDEGYFITIDEFED